MRLINADALKEYILRSVPNWSEDREIVLDCIANSPTIEERKKATWIEDGYRGLPCVCSYCGDEGKREWNYCPNCGADMREETK